jgi:hypothetical protein
MATPEAQRKYQREWMAHRRAEYFDGRCCIDCGGTDKLHLHHLDPSQKVTHRIWSWTEERRLKELAKCVVRCQECHLGGHGKDRQRHGIGRYKAGCRCNDCKAAKSVENQKYRSSCGMVSLANLIKS